MMHSSLLSLVLLLLSTVGIEATPTPRIMASSHSTTTAKNYENMAATTTASFGGVPSFKRCAFSMRGGEVLIADTQEDLDTILINANGALVVIDHWASWCGPCKMIAPLFAELSEQFSGNVIFVKVDVDENPETAAKYGVSAMPTFVFIKDGAVVDRLMGANPTRLQELIEEHK